MNLDIIEKQQVRGSSASIAQYAGKEGQIVFNRDNKRLHVMSGTAGQSTLYLSTALAATKTLLSAKLDASTYNSEKANFATKSLIPDTSALATKTEVTSGLASKVNTSTYTADKATFALKTEIPDTSGLATKTLLSGYATTTALTQGLAGKLDKTAKAASASTADSAATVPWTGVTGAPTIPDTSTLIPKLADRGSLAGYLSSIPEVTTINKTTADVCRVATSTILKVSSTSTASTLSWTKIAYLQGMVTVSTEGNSWAWVGGSAPDMGDAIGFLIVHCNGGIGLLNWIAI